MSPVPTDEIYERYLQKAQSKDGGFGAELSVCGHASQSSIARWISGWLSRPKWSVLPTWPGSARVVPVAAAQRSPKGEEFFLFSGRVQQAGRATELLSDAFAFNRNLIATWHRDGKMIKKTLGIERRHASGTGRGNGLAMAFGPGLAVESMRFRRA